MRWGLTKAHTTQPIQHCQKDDPQEGASAQNIKHREGEHKYHYGLYCHHNKLCYHM